jgi:prevent-host-death family protein
MQTQFIDFAEAQSRWRELIALARAGTEVLITDGGKPLARLIPVAAPSTAPRTPGLHPGAIRTSDDFDAPLSDDFWSPPA